MSWASEEYASVETVSAEEFSNSLWLGGLYLVSLCAAGVVFEKLDWHANRLSSASASLLGDRCKTWSPGCALF